MQLRQMNLKYDPEQDRMVLRINSTDQEEFRFFITRRYLKLLWPVLRRLLKQDYQRRSPAPPELAAPMMAFEEEKAIGQVDFKQGFTESAERFPLGEAPVLLSRIKVKKTSDSDILCMHPREGRGIELPANQEILHLFCKALRDVTKISHWDLVLQDHNDQTGEIAPSGRTVH